MAAIANPAKTAPGLVRSAKTARGGLAKAGSNRELKSVAASMGANWDRPRLVRNPGLPAGPRDRDDRLVVGADRDDAVLLAR